MTEASFLVGVQQVVLSTPWMIPLVMFFAQWAVFVNLGVATLLVRSRLERHRHAAVEAAWAGLLALALTTILSFFIQRARPFFAIHEIVLLIPPPLNTSFPSGHTATAIAVACAFFFVHRTLGSIAFVIAGFVAFGRMGVGVHYPSDILGGMVIGALSFWIVRVIHRALAHHT